MPLFVIREYPKKKVLPAVIIARELTGLRRLFGARVGDAFVSKKTTQGLFLHEICTWRPVWKDGTQGEAEQLERCYRQALQLAAQKNYQTVAVSLLAWEDPNFPRELEYDIAEKTIRAFLEEKEMTVYLVAPDFCGGDPRMLQEVRRFVEDTYVAPATTVILPPMEAPAHCSPPAAKKKAGISLPSWDVAPKPAPKKPSGAVPPAPPSISAGAAPRPAPRPAEPVWASTGALPDLTDLVRKTDAGFSETLLRLIDESGRKDSDVYNRANVSRQHFSKIRNNPQYRPTKATALAFAIALELDLEQTEDLIRRAGYTLSESIVFDVVILYFIRKGRYDLFEINEALYEFDQVLLGA